MARLMGEEPPPIGPAPSGQHPVDYLVLLTVFGLMLEDLGVADVAALAAQGPAELHARLRRYNGEERLARRSPTPGEVESWVAQARSLPVLVSY